MPYSSIRTREPLPRLRTRFSEPTPVNTDVSEYYNPLAITALPPCQPPVYTQRPYKPRYPTAPSRRPPTPPKQYTYPQVPASTPYRPANNMNPTSPEIPLNPASPPSRDPPRPPHEVFRLTKSGVAPPPLEEYRSYRRLSSRHLAALDAPIAPLNTRRTISTTSSPPYSEASTSEIPANQDSPLPQTPLRAKSWPGPPTHTPASFQNNHHPTISAPPSAWARTDYVPFSNTFATSPAAEEIMNDIETLLQAEIDHMKQEIERNLVQPAPIPEDIKKAVGPRLKRPFSAPWIWDPEDNGGLTPRGSLKRTDTVRGRLSVSHRGMSIRSVSAGALSRNASCTSSYSYAPPTRAPSPDMPDRPKPGEYSPLTDHPLIRTESPANTATPSLSRNTSVASCYSFDTVRATSPELLDRPKQEEYGILAVSRQNTIRLPKRSNPSATDLSRSLSSTSSFSFVMDRADSLGRLGQDEYTTFTTIQRTNLEAPQRNNSRLRSVSTDSNSAAPSLSRSASSDSIDREYRIPEVQLQNSLFSDIRRTLTFRKTFCVDLEEEMELKWVEKEEKEEKKPRKEDQAEIAWRGEGRMWNVEEGPPGWKIVAGVAVRV